MLEVIVVIAIIGVISALLFPAFSGAKLQSQRTASDSNMRQLAVADLLYASDFEGYLPPYMNNENILEEIDDSVTSDGLPTNSIEPPRLRACLDPYVKSKAVWFNPADAWQGQSVPYMWVNHRYTSYLFNNESAGRVSANDPLPWVTRVEDVRSSLLVYDALGFACVNNQATYWPGDYSDGIRTDLSLERLKIVPFHLNNPG